MRPVSVPSAHISCTPMSLRLADRIAHELGLSPATAAILVRRGYETPAAARAFLAADERHDASRLDGVGAACETILRHAGAGSTIVIHGDYDVDGVCSTAILVRALRALGADPGWHLPSRSDDGYGLSNATVETLAAAGTRLLVTADCGITAADEVERAIALGIDVVVTDHHRPGERLPDCPVVHPALGGYPFPDLCAAGVAHKLSEALYESAGQNPAPAETDLDLVALATVADVVPLHGENRRLVREGLRALARTRKPGLRALMRVAALDPGEVAAHAAAFRLAPRLNAAGRLQRADAALELLLTGDDARAAEIADELDLLNRERRDTETRILFAAEAARADQADAPAYVLAGEGWHEGVIGIVASRMVERHHRPCMVIALGPEGGRGSGRSIAAFDLHASLAACSTHLRRFGGHRAAAGFELDSERLDDFRRAFVRHAARVLAPRDLEPVERIDAVVPGSALGLPLAEELERLAPFGHGNPEPTLLVPAARISDVRAMGEEGQHSCFTLSNGGARARGVAFRTPPKALAVAGEGPHDVATRLETNHWNGGVEARVVLRAARPTESGPSVVLGEDPYWEAFERARAHERVEPLPVDGPGARAIRDRRGQGIAGVAGELLAAGEQPLVVCADAAARQQGLERVIGGMAVGDPLALVSWDALAGQPGLAASYGHLLAIDPPLVLDGLGLLVRTPCEQAPGAATLAWGGPEIEFARSVARADLDLRPALADVFRALRDRGGIASGPELEELLRGSGGRRRSPTVGARLVRVLVELELVSHEVVDGARCCRLEGTARTDLSRSASQRAYRVRLERIERQLEAMAGGPAQPVVAGSVAS